MKDIEGFYGIYSATKEGKIWAHSRIGKGGHSGKFLKTWLIGHGYEAVSLYSGVQRSQKFLVHRLIAGTYIPNPKKLPEVNHKNGNIKDNRSDNLEWCTSKENKAHAWKNGMYTHKGTNHYLAKLDSKKVQKIRGLVFKRGDKTKLIKKLGISFGALEDVLHRRTWKDIT